MKNTSTQGKVTSNKRWILRRELKIFMMLPVWLMGLRGIWKECFQPIHDRILKLWKSNGSLWLTQYLSEASRIIVLWLNGAPYTCSPNSIRVRLTRYGLPVFLPGPLRKIFLSVKGEDYAYALKVIRVTLTLLSVYRVIGCSPILKLGTITGPFTGVGATLLSWEVTQVVGWLPRTLVLGRVAWTYLSESAGPNFKKSTWSAGLDALAFLRDPFTWYHWLITAWSLKAWVLIAWMLLTIVCTLPFVPFLLWIKKYPKFLGRLVTLFEARGKVRVVAITDWWTQVLLRPLHEGIFDILRAIPQDGTFDQLAPVHRLLAYVRASGSAVYSYDLSAATDRLPLVFQVQVLEALGVSWAKHWGALLVGRPWYLKGSPVHYSVGQPMGALSSWAMLALSHHIMVQIAAQRVGAKEWFTHYAILGDDIVIADQAVAKAYLSLIESIGVPINMSKSFEMSSGGLEFAKRWFNPWMGDISPMSPGLILAAMRNPRIMATLIQDSLGRGIIFSTRVVPDLGRYLSIIRPRKWLDREKAAIFSMVFGPKSGLWDTASGPLFRAIWIALFPHSVAGKFDKLIGIIYQQLAESRTPPLSEEESRKVLTTNFWRQVLLLGPYLRGLVWVPFLILSPAFWVYYDLAARAEERVKEYNKLRSDFQTQFYTDQFYGRVKYFTTYGLEFAYLEGLDLSVRALAIARKLIANTFEPNLLDWDRKVAEDNSRLHKRVMKLWSIQAKNQIRIAASIAASKTQVNAWTVVQTKSQTIPTHLSLVPIWFRWEEQRITLRHGEVPQGTFSIRSSRP